MAKKKGKTTQISSLIFDDVDPYGAVLNQPATGEVVQMSIEQILPDPYQPRQMMPQELLVALFDDAQSPYDVLRQWQQRNTRDSGQMHPEWTELARLAHSIAQHGLINPITVRPAVADEAPESITHIIVTGERRFWAHVFLVNEARMIQEGNKTRDPAFIKVSIAPEGTLIRAHQIVENLLREDIDVVEKALGIWALRYELSYDAYRRQSGLDAIDDAYRRHAGDYPDDMPLVPWREVEEVLDMSRQYRGRIINVLKLSEEAQALVHEYNLAEATIRPVIAKLRQHPDLQLQALQQLILWQQEEADGSAEGRQIVPSMRALVDRLLNQKTAQPKKRSRPTPPPIKQLQKQIQTVSWTMQRLQATDWHALAETNMSAAERQQITTELRDLRQQLDEALSKLG